jgi:hypothetical protein
MILVRRCGGLDIDGTKEFPDTHTKKIRVVARQPLINTNKTPINAAERLIAGQQMEIVPTILQT